MAMRAIPSRSRAFTLIEIVVSLAIVTIVGLGLILALTDGVYIQQSIRERNGATRIAADQIESIKRELFGQIRPVNAVPVVIDDRGTENPGDDVMGTRTLRFTLPDGTVVGTEASPIPDDGSMIVVESIVAWTPAGRLSRRPQQIVLTTTLTP